jgi:uncharacterized RDD family membrane protein YckC/cytoskeletal protein CcmA (bactofilin family)
MKFQTRNLFLSTAIAVLFALVLAGLAAKAQAVSPVAAAEANSDSTLRRLDKPEPADATVSVQKDDANDDTAPEAKPARHRHDAGHDNDRVTIAADNTVAANETVTGDAVAVMGDLKVDGNVTGDAVAVCGDNTINGPVDGDVVAVLGDLKLGPKARVGGDAVCVSGTVERDPRAVVEGKIVNPSIGGRMHGLAPLHAIFGHGFRSPWVWMFNLAIIALYALVALLFPRPMRTVGDKLVEQPGMSLLAAFLTVLALPVVFLILCVTVIGIPLALLLIPAFFGLMMFGKASFYALIGRKITQDRLHLSLAVVVGALVCLIFFMIPYVGLMLTLTVSLIMVGCGVTALFGSGKKRAAPGGPAAPAAAAPRPQPLNGPGPAVSAFAAPIASSPADPLPPAQSPGVVPPAPSPSSPLLSQAEPAPVVPPPLAAPHLPSASASMPRAGFWIRTAALLIDVIIIGVASCFLPHACPFIMVILAAYGACLWKYRGSTVGGIIFGLRVVRMDDRPIDWPTSIVRALGCFLSLVALGLGFIWVAFDSERQSWHDKIAGTTVVRPPKGVSLV